MKVTIDTTSDSYEDIKKVFHILAGMIERKEGVNPLSNYGSGSLDNTGNPVPPATSSAMMSMFETDSGASTEKVSDAVKEKKVEEPGIEYY